MAKKKQAKAKEPITIRFKKLANGNQSIYLDCYVDGKRTYEFLKLYLVPETDAQAKAKNKNALQAATALKSQRIMDIANGKAGLQKANRSKVLFSDYMKAYRGIKQAKGRSEEHAKQIDNLCNHLHAYGIDKVELSDVDKKICLGFIQYLNNTDLSQGTRYKYFSMLISALNYAVKEGYIPFNPTNQIKNEDRIKRAESHREFLTVDELKSMMATPCKNEAVKNAYLFSCFCGLRISDVRALKWGNIYMDAGQLRIRIIVKKTNRELVLPISDEAKAFMPEREEKQDDEQVFNLPTLPHANIVLKKWAADAGVNKHLSFHTSRHTFATMGLTAGADLYTVSKLLGHTDVSTTQIYDKIIDKKKDEAVNKIGALFK